MPERDTKEELERFRLAMDAFGEASADYASASDRFLRKMGWKRTCDTPGSYWLWQKVLPDGRTALVSEELAIKFEEDFHQDILRDHDPDEDEEEPAEIEGSEDDEEVGDA